MRGRHVFGGWTGALALTGLFLVAACGGAAQQPSSEASGSPIKVGVLDDTSGGAAPYSSLTDRGVKYAVDEINSKGGVNGRPIQLTFESDGNVPANSPALVQKMIQGGAKFILETSGSASAVASKKTLLDAKVPGFASTNQNTSIGAQPDADYSYMQSNTSSDIANVYAQAWVKAGYKNIAVIQDDSPTISAGNAFMIPIWQKAGLNIVAQEKVALNATDATAQVSRIKAKSPDAVIMTSLGGQVEVLVQQALYTLMKNTPRFSLASIGNQPSSWDLAQPNSLDGLVYVAQVDLTNPRAKTLSDGMKKKFGSQFTWLTAYEAQGYDSVQIMKAAMEKGGNPDDPTKNKAGMDQISKFKTAAGGPGFTVSFSADKHQGADGLCGLSLIAFKGNKPGSPWKTYQPSC